MFVIRWGDGGQFDTLPFILKIGRTVKSGDRGTFLPIRGYCLCVGYHISAVMNSVVQTPSDRSTEGSVLTNLTMSLLFAVQLLSLSIRRGFFPQKEIWRERERGFLLKNLSYPISASCFVIAFVPTLIATRTDGPNRAVILFDRLAV